jgi:hypothetical protein
MAAAPFQAVIYRIWCKLPSLKGIYKSYIGQTTDLPQRWRDHKGSARRHDEHAHLYDAMSLYGISNFAIEVLHQGLFTQKQLDALEIQEICALLSDLNRQRWTDPTYREQTAAAVRKTTQSQEYRASQSARTLRRFREHPEIRIKLSLAARRLPPLSSEVRARIGAKRKGVPLSKATKAKISVSLKGRRFTAEHAMRIAKALRGNKSRLGQKLTEDHKAKISARWTDERRAAKSAFMSGINATRKAQHQSAAF